MSLVIFICPENQYLSKYCEAFYNYINFGYIKTHSWANSNGSYVSRKRVAVCRVPMKKTAPSKVQMKANDPTLERIYKKVISNDCYDHSYYKLEEQEIGSADLVVFLTDNKTPKKIPSYLNSSNVVVWKVSNANNLTESKWNLIERLIRKMLKKD
jgi:hypothetical protein